MNRVVILKAQRWSLTDENTGEIRRGTSVVYLPGVEANGRDAIGMEVMKSTGPHELYDSLQIVPAVYELDYEQSVGTDRNGRQQLTLKPVAATYVGDVELNLYEAAVAT